MAAPLLYLFGRILKSPETCCLGRKNYLPGQGTNFLWAGRKKRTSKNRKQAYRAVHRETAFYCERNGVLLIEKGRFAQTDWQAGVQ